MGVGVVPRVQSKLSRALHAHRGEKLLQDLQTQERAPMKRAMVRFRGAREKGAMAFVGCLGVSQENTMKGPLLRETLSRSLGSHDAAELVGGMCHGNGCRQETTRLHAISCTKTGWSSLTHSRVLQNGKMYPLRIDIVTEAGALFDNHPRLKDKALLLDITIVNSCAGSILGNAARHVGKHLADAVERKNNKYRGSFPATYSLLSLAMSTCGEVRSDVHALIKELTIRRVKHRSETYSNESQRLVERTEVARLRRRFSFGLQQALSFRTRHHLCRQGVELASIRQLHSQSPVSVHAHRTERVTGSEGQEGANGVGGGIGGGGGNGDGNAVGGGNGDVNGHGDGDGARAGTGTGVEVNKGAQVGDGDGRWDGTWTGTGTGTGMGIETRRPTLDGNGDGNGNGSEDSNGDGNGDEDNVNRNENKIGKGGREAKKRRKPRNSCRRHVGNGGDLGGKRKNAENKALVP